MPYTNSQSPSATSCLRLSFSRVPLQFSFVPVLLYFSINTSGPNDAFLVIWLLQMKPTKQVFKSWNHIDERAWSICLNEHGDPIPVSTTYSCSSWFLFYYCVIFHCLCVPAFIICLSFVGNLGWFNFPSVVNRVAINIDVQVFYSKI